MASTTLSGSRAVGTTRLTGAYPLRPLVVVTGFGAILPMTAAVLVLSLSGIQDAYHLGLPVLALVVAQQVQLGLGLDLPMAVVANRTTRRVVLVVMGSVYAAFATLVWFAGLFPNQILLYVALIGLVVGSGSLTSTGNAVLCDYYPVALRPRVIYAQRSAMVVGLCLCPPLVALLALGFGWEAPFFIFASAAALFVILASRLRPPDAYRDMSDGMSKASIVSSTPHASQDVPVEPATLPEAARAIYTTPSLRFIYYSMPFLLCTVFGLAFYLEQYYENVFHLDAANRATLFALSEPGAAVGLLIGLVVVPELISRNPQSAVRLIGVFALLAAAAVGTLALAPDVPVAFIAQLVFAAASVLVIAGLYSVLSATLPTRMLTLGFGLSTLWLGLGALLIAPRGVAGSSLDVLVTDAFGYRASWWIFVPLLVIGAVLLETAARRVNEDVERRKTTENADAAVRMARARGTAQLLMVRSLDAGYDGVQVIFGIDLDVSDGEMLAVLGTNGAGKSTLMRAISGLVVPSAGEVLFDGKAITTYEAHRIAEAGILQVPGGRGIFPGLTVSECLRVAGWLSGRDPQRHAEATEAVLAYFPVLASRQSILAGSLSGGEQQMLSLSMAFVARPRLLIIDELSLGLAPTVIERLIGIVRAIHEQGTAVILVEQSVNLALRLCQRAVFMEKGQIVFSGSTKELLDRQDIVRAVLLGGDSTEPVGADASEPVAGDGNEPVVGDRKEPAVRKGKELEGTEPSPASPGTAANDDLAVPQGAEVDGRFEEPEAVLRARGLYQRFGGVVAVDDVDLELYEGEILGLLGPNGAGKTTVFELLSGERRCERGRITMGGVDITSWPAYRRAAHGIGRSFQAARLWPGLTVHESVVLALSEQRSAPGTAAALFCLPTVRRSERRLNRAAQEVLEQLGLAPYSDQLTSDLSTGLRRLLELAVIVAMGPSIVLLDEPSAGLAQAETEALAPVLLDAKNRLRCSMILIEHDMGLLRRLAGRAIALDVGAVVAVGHPEDVLDHPRVIESYLGAAPV